MMHFLMSSIYLKSNTLREYNLLNNLIWCERNFTFNVSFKSSIRFFLRIHFPKRVAAIPYSYTRKELAKHERRWVVVRNSRSGKSRNLDLAWDLNSWKKKKNVSRRSFRNFLKDFIFEVGKKNREVNRAHFHLAFFWLGDRKFSNRNSNDSERERDIGLKEHRVEGFCPLSWKETRFE